MVNYSNGKIYKIVCSTTGLIYIGSTAKEFLSQRLNKHRGTYKRWKNDNTNPYTTSFKVLENDNFKIVLLELVNCNTKNELHTRERFYIESNDCVNKYIPLQSDKEYYDSHKEAICERVKERYEKNKDEINKKRREKNKDEINKKRREKAREKRAAKKREYMELYPLLFPK